MIVPFYEGYQTIVETRNKITFLQPFSLLIISQMNQIELIIFSFYPHCSKGRPYYWRYECITPR